MQGSPINIADIRNDYKLSDLDEQTVGDDPIAFFNKWFHQAAEAQISEINAMTLATVDASGYPHARIVLLKGLEHNSFVFFTNYESAKGKEVAANPRAALVFFWKELERQVRIEGTIEKVPTSDSDAYFSSRPQGSQLGAWASPQSATIPNREVLDSNYKSYSEQFGTGAVPRPPHWGGYCVKPTHIEFWQGRSSRMHDRIVFSKDDAGNWNRSRLAP